MGKIKTICVGRYSYLRVYVDGLVEGVFCSSFKASLKYRIVNTFAYKQMQRVGKITSPIRIPFEKR